MNKEQQQIIDKVYGIYFDTIRDDSMDWLDEKQFIDKIKTDTFTSELWGLKIEERELSAKERWDWYRKNGGPSGEQKLVALMVYEDEEDNSHIHSWLKTWAPNVPTKLITITYNDKTIESYE
jgi:hypothetical protein